jgi:D-glycero-alpha-D-manno-heptose-7-phosphate kinase
MLISQTPLRVSFAGGGSDLPSFYRQHGGAVLSTAIDKYVYVTVSEKFDHALRISYSRTEEVDSVDHIEHPLVREALRLLSIRGGLEITSVADIPSRGTGLGSSSSFTVGLLHALHAAQGRHVSSDSLAEQACEIEIELCGEPIGKQDQYAAAFGGLNFIEFQPDDTVRVSPIICHRKTLQELQSGILVFYTGITRSASQLLQKQGKLMASDKKKAQVMKNMVQLAHDLRAELQRNSTSTFGEILHEGWLLKRRVAEGITNPKIDAWYQKARRAGATGGKILGAGSGGFLLFHAPIERHAAVRKALSDLREVPLHFEPRGSRIIFVH